MSTATRTVSRNVAVQILGRAGSAVLGLLLVATLTRAVPLHEFGALSTALAVLGMLAVLHDFGAGPIAVRTIARESSSANDLLSRLTVARLAAAVPLAGLGVGVLAITGLRGEILGWAAVALTLVLGWRSIEIVDVALQVAQRMGRSVAASLGGRAGHLALVLLLAAAGIDRAGPYLVAAAGGVVVSATLRTVWARQWCRIRPRLDLAPLRPFLRETLPSAGAAILMVLYLHVDAPIVLGLAGAEEAALYNAPYRLFLLGASLPGLVMVSASPVLAVRWASDAAGFRRAARRLLVTATAAAVVLGIAVVMLAPWILRVLFGASYEASASTLRLLAVAAVATAPGTIATAALIAGNRALTTTRLAAVALILNVALDLALVPFVGRDGAAVATLSTEVLVAVVGSWLLLRGKNP